MATAIINGIATRYEVVGAGPPLLMCAPSAARGILGRAGGRQTEGTARVLEFLNKVSAES